MRRAFTLIELAIVLTIIGLIIAGVVSGSSLVRQTQARATLAQMHRYKTAMLAFRAQYDAYPGDMTNASSFWGTAANGDGNGSIDLEQEIGGFWHHLGLSGFIPGSYSGSYPGLPVPGIDNPPAAHNETTNLIITEGGIYGRWKEIFINIVSSKSGCSNARWCAGAPLAYTLYWENKADDGIPNLGNILTLRGWDTPAGQCCSASYPGSSSETYSNTTDSGGYSCWVFWSLK